VKLFPYLVAQPSAKGTAIGSVLPPKLFATSIGNEVFGSKSATCPQKTRNDLQAFTDVAAARKKDDSQD
jgi:hypothetical protein